MNNSKKYVTFQEYPNPNSALELIEVLKESSIEALFEEDSIDFDPTYSGNFQRRGYRVKLRKEDFEKADKVLLLISEASLDNVEKGYYLLDFTQEELMEVIAKKDEWNRYDFLLAKKLLAEKGVIVDDQKIETLKQERLLTLAEGISAPRSYMAIGFLFALLGGFVGLLMGWYFWTHKKTLPNGDRTYTFKEEERNWGQIMFWIGLVVFAIAVLKIFV